MSKSEVVKIQRFSVSCRVHTRSLIKKVGEKKISILYWCRDCKRSLLFRSKKEVRLHVEAHKAGELDS